MFYYGLEWQSLDSYMQFKEISAPDTPQADEIRQYASDSGGISTMCWKNDAGNVTCLPTSGGTLPAGSGAPGAVAFWLDASTLSADDPHFHWDDTNDQLLIGINSGSHFGTDAGLVVDEDAHSAIIGHSAHSNVAIDSGAANFTRSRGTHASPSIVQSSDRLMRLVAQGYDGAVYLDAAAIDGEVDGTPGASDMPGRLRFLTTPDGSTTLTERMRIGSDGKIFAGDSFTSGHTGADGVLEIDKNATNAILSLAAHQTAAGTLSGLFMHRSRGTHTSPSILSDGDNVGFILAKGYGSDYHDLGYILFQVDGTPGSNDMPGRILFATTPDGSASAVEAWRITNAGVLRGSISGGNTIIGGVAAADDLILRATAGNGVGSEAIIFQVGNNGATEAARFISSGQLQMGSAQAAIRSLWIDQAMTSTAFISVGVQPTYTGGAVSALQGLNVQPTFSPTGNVGDTFGVVCFVNVNPDTGATITQAKGGLFKSTTGNGAGAVTTMVGGQFELVYGSIKPTNAYGVYITDSGATGVAKAVGIGNLTPTNATANYAFELSADAVDPTGGGGAATGRVPCLIAGVVRYLAYY